MKNGASVSEATDMVRYAVDLGVTFIETARSYATEQAVMAVKGRQDRVVISAKGGVSTTAELFKVGYLAG